SRRKLLSAVTELPDQALKDRALLRFLEEQQISPLDIPVSLKISSAVNRSIRSIASWKSVARGLRYAAVALAAYVIFISISGWLITYASWHRSKYATDKLP